LRLKAGSPFSLPPHFVPFYCWLLPRQGEAQACKTSIISYCPT
jgi:hypothetical protein